MGTSETAGTGRISARGFEVTFGGGRIDRVDIMEDQNKVYVKVIDYKTGNTSFDLVYLISWPAVTC